MKEIRPGEIVEFLLNNQICIGCVLEKDKKQLKVINLNQRLVKLSTSRVLPWVGPTLPYSGREEILKALNEHEKKRAALEEQIDVVELWETVKEDLKEIEIDFAASLLWEKPDRDQIAALGRKLFKSRTHFRFEPPFFRVYSEEEVEHRLKEEEANKERKRIIEKGQEFFVTLLQGKQLPKIEKELEEKLKEILFEKIKESHNKHIESLWKEITSGLNPNPFLPLIIARKWGIIPKHYNYLLDQADYEWGDEWSYKFFDSIERIVQKLKDHQKPAKKLPVVSIDSETTKDIDDAIFVKRHDDLYEVVVALACPVLFWEFESDLDNRVIHRCSSIYLPEGTSHMLPEVLATKFYSLHSDSPKPSIVIRLKLNKSGEIVEESVDFDWIEVEENTTYSNVEKDLEVKKEESKFFEAYELAKILRDKRIEKGAVIVEQPEPVIELVDREGEIDVDIKEPDQYPKAQLIVSELMVLINSFIAKWAKERDIPLIHRTQDMIVPDDAKGVWTDPVDIYRVMKEMGPSILETTPKPHVSLGVELYSPVSSPIRRYPDFLNVAQIFSYLESKRPKFSYEDLEQKLPYISSRLQMVTKIQKYRTRYWKLLYFKKFSKDKMWSGVVVGEEGENLVFSLPKEQILLKAPKKLLNTKDFLGKKVNLKLGQVDPLTNTVKVVFIKEEKN